MIDFEMMGINDGLPPDSGELIALIFVKFVIVIVYKKNNMTIQ